MDRLGLLNPPNIELWAENLSLWFLKVLTKAIHYLCITLEPKNIIRKRKPFRAAILLLFFPRLLFCIDRRGIGLGIPIQIVIAAEEVFSAGSLFRKTGVEILV